ncbi:MAG: hypothetical protein HYV41_02430 [Candidatus Magasanikbacteria bacterium]|nr:hypothetical protein [Candidatus Magasanikbacteria bacterium]
MPKTIDENSFVGEVLHEWSVPEYEQHVRNTAWFVIMGILSLAFIAYAIFTGNFLFALIIVLFGIIIFLQSHQEPIIIPFRITDMGLVINNRFYTFSEFDKFYVIFNPHDDAKMLYVETHSLTRPTIRVPLMDMDPNEVRMTLREFMEEDLEKEEEPFSDMFARKWRIH